MMNFTKRINTLFALAMLCSTAFVSHLAAKEKSKDPIVGAWWFNQTGDTQFGTVYGVALFKEDGTWVGHDSANLTQFISSDFPLGQYVTVASGTWTKNCDGTYAIEQSFVLLARGLDSSKPTPETPCSPTSDPAAPACPLFRVKTVANFVFDKRSKCKKATSEGIGIVGDLATFIPVDPQPPGLTFSREYFKLNALADTK